MLSIPAIRTSGQLKTKKIKAFITWARENTSCENGGNVCTQIQLADFDQQQRPAITCCLHGKWAQGFPLKRSDVVVVQGAQVISAPSGRDALDHSFQLVLDGSEECQDAVVQHFTWKQRVMGQQGTKITFESLSALLNVTKDEDTPSSKPLKKKKTKKKEEYDYTPIEELFEGADLVNIYGIITAFSKVKTSKGSDLYTTISVRGARGGKLDINVFRERANLLPRPTQVGDILRIHRLKIQTFRGELQGVLMRNQGSFITIDGTLDAPMNATSQSHPKYAAPHEDVVQCLRALGASCDFEGGGKAKTLRLEQLTEKGFCDMLVKVIEIQQVLVYVWDGTDISVNTDHKCMPNGIGMDFGTGTTQISPLCGSILPIRVPEEDRRMLKKNAWFKLRNVSIEFKGGSLFIQFNFNSKIMRVSDDMYPVKRLISDYEARCEKEYASVGQGGSSNEFVQNIASKSASIRLHTPSLTSVRQERMEQPIVSLKSVVAFNKDNWKFRVRARVASHFPENVEQMTQPYCSSCRRFCGLEGFAPGDEAGCCASCGQQNCVRFEYLLNLKLFDGSDSLDVILTLENARTFFSGLEPVELSSNTASRRALEKRMAKLIDPESWVELCLFSYTSPGIGRAETEQSLVFHGGWDVNGVSGGIEDSDISPKPKRRKAFAPGAKQYQIFDSMLI